MKAGQPELLGREVELATLHAGLDDALAGHARLFLIAGDAGMGKSRLVEEAAASARDRGVRVVPGRCWEAVDAPAYWPWIQVLRQLCSEMDDSALRSAVSGAPEVARLVPQLAERLGVRTSEHVSSDHRFGLFDSVATFVHAAAATKPMMVILEDLHAADESSLSLLQFLVKHDREVPLMLVGTYDEVAARARPEQERLLSDTARDAHRLTLSGLDEEAVKQLYEKRVGERPSDAIARALSQATEGNPLFIDEAIRMLTAKGDIHRPDHSVGFRVPKGARGIIRRRLEGLGEDVRELLSVAAVIGREFDVTLLQRVVDIEIEPLLELLTPAVSAEIISETSALGRYAFTHILIRETLYEDLTTTKRMRLHRTVAETLEESYAAPPEAKLPELAHHWFKAAQAGDAVKTMRYAIHAAESALAQHAYEEAIRLFQRALKVSVMAGAGAPEIEKIRAGLANARSKVDAPDLAHAATASGEFVREGDYWRISYDGTEIRLRDSKGLRYIAQLLKVPGREVHVLDLATAVEGRPISGTAAVVREVLAVGNSGDAGEILDANAKAAYKKRLEDLREELEEAQTYNDPERSA
ncbi:MAG TPA: AAA family ATPase, partial [Actinomycetota bacterium]|nr:AAA family ATPase [Actinomycetota bacterium]